MYFLYDNAAVLAIAAVCGAFAWLYGGTMPSALMPAIPWLVVLLVEMAVFFPQRHSGETTTRARARTMKAIMKDPLTWVSVALLALLAIPFFNKAMCPCCDYPAIHFDGVRQAPPYPFLPSCINKLEHLSVFVWFGPALLCAVACRHALLKRGKRTLLELLVWNGLALSFIGLLQRVTDAKGPLWISLEGKTAYFFSTFGYPNMGGDYFTTLFCVSYALWRWNFARYFGEAPDGNDPKDKAEHKKFWRKHLMLVPTGIFFFSAIMTLSRASILLVCALAVIFFLHATISFLAGMSKAARVKTIAANIIAIALIAAVATMFFGGVPAKEGEIGGDVAKEVSTLDTRGILDRVTGRQQYHTRVAKEIWKKHFFFGCGGWGYKHLCIPEMTDAEFANIQAVGGINVHNDYIQFLAEHGTVGFALICLVFALLLYPTVKVWKGLVRLAAFSKSGARPPKPIAVFSLPAGAFAILCAVAATMIHALADCPLRSPAVLSLFFVSLAAADGFLPNMNEH